MSNSGIPFNLAHVTGRELVYLQEALASRKLAGDGSFTKRCNLWLEAHLGVKKALLTHSCTAALEMAALLLDLKSGDEVILPSYTFCSTANAIALRGATCVFVDCEPGTMNMDVTAVAEAITTKTRAIFVVHYAGISCDMDAIIKLAAPQQIFVVEDAAQAILSTYKGRKLGSIGHLAALSFHETKNIVSGEGGALLVNDERFIERAEIIREKGTNRSQFFRGQVDKYTWVDLGSSYLPSDLLAAVLLAQLEEAESIGQKRLHIWQAYHHGLAPLEQKGYLRRPVVPDYAKGNGHIYFIQLPNLEMRTQLIDTLKKQGIQPTFHYIPLHTSPAGQKYGRFNQPLTNTDHLADCLLRLPLFPDLQEVDRVVTAITDFFEAKR